MDASIWDTETRPVTAGSSESGFWNTATVRGEPLPLPLPVTGPELPAVHPLASATVRVVPTVTRAERNPVRRWSRKIDMQRPLAPSPSRTPARSGGSHVAGNGPPQG